MNKETRLILKALHRIIRDSYFGKDDELTLELKEVLNPKESNTEQKISACLEQEGKAKR